MYEASSDAVRGAYTTGQLLNPFCSVSLSRPLHLCTTMLRSGYRAEFVKRYLCVVCPVFFYGSTERTNRSQQMAASTSKSSKATTKSQRPYSNKGKGKENISQPAQTNSCAWDARNYDDVTPWNWTSLTDPSSTRIPPLFTKDGK